MAAKHKRRAGEGDYHLRLPLEICIEVLNRLPVKSILRFRSVCKSWHSHVSCPNFISDYSTRNLNKYGSRVLLLVSDYSKPWSFSPLDDKIVGSCNGLICLSKYDVCNGLICLSKYDVCASNHFTTVTYVIWNPTTRKKVELPSRTCAINQYFSYSGFGFDSKTSDYKVLCTVRDYIAGNSANKSEIYDLSKGVWRGISPVIPPLCFGGRRQQECYLNGAVHWTGYGDRSFYDRCLLSFHMDDECFGETWMPSFAELAPDGDYHDDRIQTRSVSFGGLIHVMMWMTDKNGFADVSQSCSIWTMKEYGVTESWTKMFDIDLQNAQLLPDIDPYLFRLWKNGEVLIVHHLGLPAPRTDADFFCLWKNGEILTVCHPDLHAQGVEVDEDAMTFGDHQWLIWYNSESKKCKDHLSIIRSIDDVCLCEESLALM